MSKKGENCFLFFFLAEKIRVLERGREREDKRQYQMSCGKMQKPRERGREGKRMVKEEEENFIKIQFFSQEIVSATF